MQDLTTDFGLTREHTVFDGPDELANLLDKNEVPHTRLDLPNIVGMNGAAWLMGYVSPDTGEHVTVLVIPRRPDVDSCELSYYYFDGMPWEDAIAPGVSERWADLYERCEDVDRELLRAALRPPGRPEVGPVVKVRLPESVIESVDELAEAAGVSRAAWIRDLVVDAVQARRES